MARKGSVLDREHPGTQCLFVAWGDHVDARILAKLHDIQRQVRVVGWEIDIGVAVTNEVCDVVESDVDFVGVQVIELCVEFRDGASNFGLGVFANASG